MKGQYLPKNLVWESASIDGKHSIGVDQSKPKIAQIGVAPQKTAIQEKI